MADFSGLGSTRVSLLRPKSNSKVLAKQCRILYLTPQQNPDLSSKGRQLISCQPLLVHTRSGENDLGSDSHARGESFLVCE